MRKASISLVFVCALMVVAMGRASQRTQNQDEQKLRQIEATTAKCEQQNDASMISLFADDFVAAGKTVLSKQQLEHAVKDNFVAHGNGPSPFAIEKKDMHIYLFGGMAVVTYIKEYRQTPDTSKVFDEDDADVFRRGPKGWLLQFSKISVLTPS